MQKQDLFMLVLFFAFLFIMQAMLPYIPPGLGRTLASVVMMAGMFGIMGMMQVMMKEIYNKYPHFEMIIRPEKTKVDLFWKKRREREKEGGGFTNFFELGFAAAIDPYGKVNGFRLIHKKPLTEHLQLDPGPAQAGGWWFDHPHSEIIEVERLSEEITRAEPFPVFRLVLGSKDTVATPIMAMATTNPDIENHPYVLNLQAKYDAMEARYAKSHEGWISSENIIDQQRIETRGLLKAFGSIVALAVELLLTLLEYCGSIDKAIKALQPKRWVLPAKALAIVGTVAIVALYLHYNPPTKQLAPLNMWLAESPLNWVYLIVLLIIGVVALYYIVREVRKKVTR